MCSHPFGGGIRARNDEDANEEEDEDTAEEDAIAADPSCGTREARSARENGKRQTTDAIAREDGRVRRDACPG